MSEDDVVEEEEESISEKESESEDTSDSESEKGLLLRGKIDNKKSNQDPDKVTDLSSVSSSKLIVPNRTDWFNIVEVPAETPEKLDRFAREDYWKGHKTIEKDNKTYLEEFASNTSQRSSCLKSCLMVL